MGFRKVLNDKTPLICAILWVANMGGDISSPALTKRDCLTVASMARFGGIADFLSLPFVRSSTASSREIFHVASFDAREP